MKTNKIFKVHDSAYKMFNFTRLQNIHQSRETFPFSSVFRTTTFQPSNISSLAGSKAAVFRAAPPERVPPATARGRGVGRGGGGPGGGPAAAGRGRRHPPQPRPSAPPHQTCPRRAGRRRGRQRDSQARMFKVFDKGAVSQEFYLQY
jgi:hypothetical protein